MIDFKKELERSRKRKDMLGESWAKLLGSQFDSPYMKDLGKYITVRRSKATVYPLQEELFKAFQLTPYEDVKVVILGQDPYNDGAAHGLAFSKKPGFKSNSWLPPSLEVIFKAIQEEISASFSSALSGDLTSWAKQGILLLNPILTVEHKRPTAHESKGWEKFTSRVIDVLNDHPKRLVFLLWGNYAKSYYNRISVPKNLVIQASHPVSSKYNDTEWNSNESFKRTNEFLKTIERKQIEW
ncbi:hypothetical protein LCGC14_0246260 [marine sediment metagenome]|uniref:Uracil-DNA glycosylase-like domain-containing protein n=1 Tax=marine sediment metagenome TaxID=412755 RepID=A0A0F9U686_9ZZZZ